MFIVDAYFFYLISVIGAALAAPFFSLEVLFCLFVSFLFLLTD
jgi:drug/metabolite transporter (DMT)-like permease